MAEMTELRKVQQRTHQLLAFEDGLWDVLLGLVFLALAVYPVTRELLGPEWNFALFLGLLGILVGGQLVVRHYVSSPRIGYARPYKTPKLRLVLFFTIVMFLLTLGLVLVTLLSPGAEPAADDMAVAAERGYLVELIVVLVLGGIFSAMGYILGITRLYFYGWMLGLANLASIYMEHNAGWTFQLPLALAAGMILVIGLVYLLRFLGKYPVRAEGA